MYSLLAQIDISNSNTFAPAKLTSISTILNFVIPFITIGAAGAFLFMLLYAAFTWVTAGDNPENLTKAYKIMTYSVLGLVMVIFSYLAIKLIGVVFNLGDSLPF